MESKTCEGCRHGFEGCPSPAFICSSCQRSQIFTDNYQPTQPAAPEVPEPPIPVVVTVEDMPDFDSVIDLQIVMNEVIKVVAHLAARVERLEGK